MGRKNGHKSATNNQAKNSHSVSK